MIFSPVYTVLMVPILLCSAYCVMVCTCIAGRMTSATSGVVRWPIVILGAIAAWAILRTIEGEWHPNWSGILHGAAVVMGAAALGALPRIRT